MAKREAEYFRDYRKKQAEMQETREQELVRAGVSKCIEYLRQSVAGQAVTGHRAAQLLERAMLATEAHEVTARRQFVAALRGGQGEAKS